MIEFERNYFAFLLSWGVSVGLILLWLICTYYFWFYGNFNPWLKGKVKNFPFLSTFFVVFALITIIFMINHETTFRQNVSLENKLIKAREEEIEKRRNKEIHYKTTENESFDEKVKRLLKEAENRNEKAIIEFEKIPNIKDK